MSHFDTSKDTSDIVDAILTQKNPEQNADNIIAYASRALSPTEEQYSQTEKEALAIVWGIEHFPFYFPFLFGAPFTLVTDHRPLELIYNNPRSRPPALIEPGFSYLQSYDFQVKYRAGSEYPADILLRHPRVAPLRRNMAEECVNT